MRFLFFKLFSLSIDDFLPQSIFAQVLLRADVSFNVLPRWRAFELLGHRVLSLLLLLLLYDSFLVVNERLAYARLVSLDIGHCEVLYFG